MEHQEQLKSMLVDLINKKDSDAQMKIHDYFVAKMRDVAGLAHEEPPVEVETDNDADDQE